MKSIKEINERIKKGKAVVLTASEVKKLAEGKKSKEVLSKIDIVTTATFSPMCSSGVFLNLGHTKPPMKMQKVFIDGVQAYGGIAAVDVYLGATEQSKDNPRFGGAHIIQKLVKGLPVKIIAEGSPSDCYPRKKLEGRFHLNEINQAFFFNPRNCYQNYNAATNTSQKALYTYMGKLSPNMGNINFAGTGEISPLINDPEFRTIGIGTRIFFCGAEGYVAWEGTQFNPNQTRDALTGLPVGPAGTLSLIGNLKEMKPEYIRPIVVPGYGISISLGIGFAIPVLDSRIAESVLIRNKSIKTQLIDFASRESIGIIDYDQLHSGKVEFDRKAIPTRTMTDLKAAEKITVQLKKLIEQRQFYLTEPVRCLPVDGSCKKFPEK